MAGDPWNAPAGPFPSSGKGSFFENLLASQAGALHVTPKTLKNAQPSPVKPRSPFPPNIALMSSHPDHGPSARPAVKDTRPPIQSAPYYLGQPVSTHSSTGTPIYFRPSKTPNVNDLLWSQAIAPAIGKKALAQAANPRVAALQTVLGDATGIPSVVDAVRSHNTLATGANLAMFLPFGRVTKVFKGAEDVAKIAKGISSGEALGPKTLAETATEALKGSEKAYETQRALRAPELVRRFEEHNRILQENPTAEGAKQAAAVLRGVYPQVRWGNFTEFNDATYNAMVKHITDHPGLNMYEPKRAVNALNKIRGGVVPTPSERKLLIKALGHETTSDLVASVSKFHRFKTLGLDIANAPRAVMASIDVSGAGRQGLLIGTSHPAIFAKNLGPMFHGLVSEKFYQERLDALHARPNALNGLYAKSGIDFTELTPKGSRAVQREEPFRSPLAEKIPGIRASGRAFTIFLDGARADLADLLYAQAERGGNRSVLTGRKFAPRDIHNDTELQQSIGTFINSASGRGDLGQNVLGRSQEGLNLLLFSPRLIKSRVNFLNPYWYYRLDPLARSQAIRAMSGLALMTGTALALAHQAGSKVNLNPTSSDFAKIKIGSTRLDLAGGFQQYLRLASEIATQHTTTSSGVQKPLGGAYGQTSMLALVMNFWRAKLAPVVSAGVDVLGQKTAIGQPLSIQNSVVSRITPLSLQDAYQAAGAKVPLNPAKIGQASLGNIPAGLAAFIGSGIGAGVQTYQSKPPKFRGGGGGGGNPWGAGGGSSGGNPWGAP